LRPHIWPGLALAGGVLIAAVVALLLIGAGGPAPGQGTLPSGIGPGDTRLFPPQAAVVGHPGPAKHPEPAASRPAEGRGTAPETSAAESQYDAGGNRGLVLSGP
jgi:hypothetical protein